MTQAEIERKVNGMMLKDLRIELRARSLSPAGGIEALRERLVEAMVESGNMTLVSDGNHPAQSSAAQHTNNNYGRPEGQNVGNFITDRPSSKVLAAPGGESHFSLGWDNGSENNAPKPKHASPVSAPVAQSTPEPVKRASPIATKNTGSPVLSVAEIAQTSMSNNYARPSGQQNVGNFITDRPSSRVLAAPGGASQISFG